MSLAIPSPAVQPLRTVTYQSRGRLLLIGPVTAITAALPEVVGVDVSVLLLAPPETRPEYGVPTLVAEAVTSLSGYLGAFRVQARTAEGTVSVAAALGQAEDCFDLILDLCPSPLLSRPVPPPGYHGSAGQPGRLQPALKELAGLRGVFEKPRYFDYEAGLCAHSARALSGCSNCLRACPAEAISSEAGAIVVDPHLCQGCGICATVCPSGAMRYAWPGVDESLRQIRAALAACPTAADTAPLLVLHNSEAGAALIQAAAPLPADIIALPLEQVSAAGMELWCAALAYGAGTVLILSNGTIEAAVRAELEWQMELAGTLLEAMGHERDRIRHLSVGDDAALRDAMEHMPRYPALAHSGFEPLGDKREILRRALDELLAPAATLPAPLTLTEGAPFGALQVDTQACTLCMACVTVCPMNALSDGVDLPRLAFQEDACVQCGLCRQACPEEAITLLPRFDFDSAEAGRTRVLHAAEVFNCISCGKPFATASMIATITSRLADNPMFRENGMDALRMCADCRVRSHFHA